MSSVDWKAKGPGYWGASDLSTTKDQEAGVHRIGVKDRPDLGTFKISKAKWDSANYNIYTWVVGKLTKNKPRWDQLEIGATCQDEFGDLWTFVDHDAGWVNMSNVAFVKADGSISPTPDGPADPFTVVGTQLIVQEEQPTKHTISGSCWCGRTHGRLRV